MHYHSASLFFLGSSIFLAWWCLCLLSLPSGCLLICLFGGFLTPSSLLLCTWNSAEWWKSRDETKPQNHCQWPGHHCQGIQTIRVFVPVCSCSILPERCKSRVCCLYSELKLPLANLFMWEGLANSIRFAVIPSYSQSARMYSGMAKSQSLKQALKGRAGR